MISKYFQILLPIFLVFSVSGCNKSSDASPQGGNQPKPADAQNPAEPIRAALTGHAWCVKYVDVDPTNVLYDIPIEERTEYLPNGIVRIDKYKLDRKGEDRLRNVESFNKKWELSGNLVTTTSQKGTIKVGTVTFDDSTKQPLNIVWQTGDRGINYYRCN